MTPDHAKKRAAIELYELLEKRVANVPLGQISMLSEKEIMRSIKKIFRASDVWILSYTNCDAFAVCLLSDMLSLIRLVTLGNTIYAWLGKPCVLELIHEIAQTHDVRDVSAIDERDDWWTIFERPDLATDTTLISWGSRFKIIICIIENLVSWLESDWHQHVRSVWRHKKKKKNS